MCYGICINFAKANVFLPQVTILFVVVVAKIKNKVERAGKAEINEAVRSPVSRHSTPSYSRTYTTGLERGNP